MTSPIRGRALIDVNSSVRKHHMVVEHVLSAHGLSGCDTVATYFGIEKLTVLKILKKEMYILSKVDDIRSSLPDVIDQSTAFMLLVTDNRNVTQ